MTRADAADAGSAPDLPAGTLVRSRVESDPAVPLAAALDRELTGYAVLEPQDALLLDAEGACVLAFEEGVPRFACHTGTGAGGPRALADVAAPGPFDVELRAVPAEAVAAFGRSDRRRFRVPPGMAAERLAGDPDLAERTRAAAPSEWQSGSDGRDSDGEDGPDGTNDADDESADDGVESLDAVEAFLDDEEKIAAIRDRAREEAKERAAEWGLDDQLQ